MVAKAGSELFAAENELDSQLAFGFLDFGENDNLTGAIGSGRAGRVTDFTAKVFARCHAHPYGNGGEIEKRFI